MLTTAKIGRGKIFLGGCLVFCGGNCFLCGKKRFEVMAQHNLPAQSLDPLPKNPTLFGYFEGSDVKFENSGEDFARIFSEVLMGEYGVPLSLREAGISMLLMPTGVVIEDDTVKLTYHYAESGGLAVLAVSLTDGACTCEMLHLTGGEGVNVSWDKITNKPDGIEPAIVVLSGSPEEEASYTEEVIAEISALTSSNLRDTTGDSRTNKIMSQDAVTKKLINTLTLTGDVTGTGTPADGNLSVATTIHGAAKTVTLTGAVTGTGTAEDGTATVDTTLSGSAN